MQERMVGKLQEYNVTQTVSVMV